MGWRFRKRINFGNGFRINLSKSGIGYSWGCKGFRITKKANGGIKNTYNLPGTGISYVQETETKKTSTEKLPKANSMERYNLEHSKKYPVINGKIDALSTSENLLFIKKLKSKLYANFITKFIGGLGIFFSYIISYLMAKDTWIYVFGFFSVIIISIVSFINSLRFVKVEYEIDNDVAELIVQRNTALSFLSNCNKIWAIEGYYEVAYARVNAGADTNIKRKEAKLIYDVAPRYLKIAHNMKVYQLHIGKTKYIFLPDKILVVKFLRVGAMKYSDIQIVAEDTNFVENKGIPLDTKTMCFTWKYVNNNGTPDRRFKNNRQLPVCAYKTICLKSETGLNIHLLLSSSDKAKQFKIEWEKIKELF